MVNIRKEVKNRTSNISQTMAFDIFEIIVSIYNDALIFKPDSKSNLYMRLLRMLDVSFIDPLNSKIGRVIKSI